jgi:hypothetical protein
VTAIMNWMGEKTERFAGVHGAGYIFYPLVVAGASSLFLILFFGILMVAGIADMYEAVIP